LIAGRKSAADTAVTGGRPDWGTSSSPGSGGAQTGEIVSASPSNVGIYRVTLGITTYVWLCGPCATERAAKGWTLERTGTVETFGCDDC
jgi:hypothetical protein